LQGVELGLIDQTTGQDTPNNNNKRSVGYIVANHGDKITLSGFTSSNDGLRIFVYQDEVYIRNYTVSASTNTYFTITIPNDGNMIRFQGSNGKFTDYIQAELGETATSYEPYQRHTYTSTFGQTVYGGKDEVVSGKLYKEWEYIASYNGETLPGEWISDRDVYAPGTTPTTGAEVCYNLATPTEITLTPEEIALLKGTNVLSTDGDSIELKYKQNF
jgi:hypothetical protein